MTHLEKHVVTGAFGYSGKYIARRLLAAGHRVATLTNSPNRPHEFGGRVEVMPLSFDDGELAASLSGTRVLYNTYWVRFDHEQFTHDTAVTNTLALFAAAKRAGVHRIVHVSITNPTKDSALPYFAGKALLEEALLASCIPCSILRPAVLFGGADILINNIAWALRTFPVFGLFDDGSYRLRPIHVEDLADLAVSHGAMNGTHQIDAVGPESYSYADLVSLIGRAIGHPRPTVSLPPSLGHLLGRVIGCWKKDVFITREEIAGLMAGLLDTRGPATGTTSLSKWLENNGDHLGRSYASELQRRRERTVAYGV